MRCSTAVADWLNGEVVYHHAMLGAALVCPGRREAIPLMPEPILNGDGQKKNDCERNALRRWLRKFRLDHPHLRVIATLEAMPVDVIGLNCSTGPEHMREAIQYLTTRVAAR